MKVDIRASKYPVTRDQHFFLSCWFNLVHEFSLDSYRVRTMNTENALRELRRIIERGTEEEIEMVQIEAISLIESDGVLGDAPFKKSRDLLLEVLAKSDFKKKKDSQSLAEYFIAELVPIIEKQYVDAALLRLNSILIDNSSATISEEQRFRDIESTLNYLLSLLLDREASLESLFSLYIQILAPRSGAASYNFSKKFGLLQKILMNEPKSFLIVLAIENVSKQQDFPAEIGGIKFLKDSPCSQDPDQRESAYLASAPRKLFAVQNVSAREPRAAGTIAFDNLNDILNLVRFEYEREHVATPDMFAFTTQDKLQHARVFSLPKVVPNPSAIIDGVAVSEFIKSVNELVKSDRFQAEGRDRVYSAFRLYRTGLDAPILANKLMNWWTAIEFLVRGQSTNGSIGKSVESMLAPVLCRTYLAKLLIAVRNVLLDLGVTIVDPRDQSAISLRGVPLSALYKLMRRHEIQAEILKAVSNEPYVERHVTRFFGGLNDFAVLSKLLSAHENRVRAHLQRLYRARCDIVHSARLTVSTPLLCACLEYYIKTALMSLLRALRSNPTLSSAKEFFDREKYEFEKMKASLSKGDDDSLLLHLTEMEL